MTVRIEEDDQRIHHVDCFAPADEIRKAIARRAYEIYCSRGRTGGHELDDWLQAEEEVLGVKHEPHSVPTNEGMRRSRRNSILHLRMQTVGS